MSARFCASASPGKVIFVPGLPTFGLVINVEISRRSSRRRRSSGRRNRRSRRPRRPGARRRPRAAGRPWPRRPCRSCGRSGRPWCRCSPFFGVGLGEQRGQRRSSGGAAAAAAAAVACAGRQRVAGRRPDCRGAKTRLLKTTSSMANRTEPKPTSAILLASSCVCIAGVCLRPTCCIRLSAPERPPARVD